MSEAKQTRPAVERQEPKRKVGRPKGGTSPTLQERSTAIALAERGMSMTDIGRLMNRDRTTISRILAECKDVLTFAAEQAAQHVVIASGIAALKGDHRPAWAILQNAGVVEKDASGDGGGVRVSIGIALPGLPGADRNRSLVASAGESVEAVTVQQVTED